MRFMAMARLVCAFAGDGAEAHGAGGETLDDVGCGLDLVQRHVVAGLELHQPAQGEQTLALFIDGLGE